MAVDLVEIVRAAVAAEVAPLRADVAELRAALRRPSEALLPLAKILGITPGAARMREARNPALLAAAVQDSRSRLYRVADVERVLGMTKRPPASPAAAEALSRARAARHKPKRGHLKAAEDERSNRNE